MSKLLKEGLARQIRSWIIMTFGLFVNALGWTAFLIPGKMVGEELPVLQRLFITLPTDGYPSVLRFHNKHF